MKTYTYALLLAAAATGMALGQTAYTTPVGYTTQALPSNTLSLVGINLLTPTLVSGKVTAVSGAQVTDTNNNFTTALVHNSAPVTTGILEITSGAAAGTVQEFVTYSGSAITLPAAVAGIAVGDSYKVRRAPSLQELLPAGGGAVSSAVGATGADTIWIPTGTGSYTKYWWKNGTPAELHTTVTGTTDAGIVTAPVPIVYVDGLLIQKKTSTGSFVLSGEVKKGNSKNLVTGLYPVTVPSPAGLTLFTAGLNVNSAIGATGSDVVWVPTGPGTFNKYWKKNDGVWHTTSNSAIDTGIATDTALPAVIYIQRKSGSLLLNIDAPAFYSNL